MLWATAEEACERVRSYGFSVIPAGMSLADRLAAFLPHMDEVMALPPRRRRALFFSRLFGWAAAPRMYADLGPAFDTFRPDVVVSESPSWPRRRWWSLAACPMIHGTPMRGKILSVELNDLLTELFERIAENVHDAVDGLDADALSTPPVPGTNPIGWLVWHLTRVQDHHLAEILGQEQVWVSGDWAPRFGVAADPDNTGYGHSEQDVMGIRPAGADVLIEYYDAVAARTHVFLERTTPHDLDRIVDDNWDPPVSLGVRLVSIADDGIQHAGQASYAKGIIERRSRI